MNGSQTLTESRTIITLALGLLGPLLALGGYKFESTDQVALANGLALLWTGGAMLVAAYFRIKATKQITVPPVVAKMLRRV